MYATAADFRDRYPARDLQQLTDLDESCDRDAVLAAAAGQAAAVIDGYLAARYALPLTAAPPILTELSVDIAIYRLQVLRPQNDIEDARRRYEDAILYLKLVAKGDADLPGQTAAAAGVDKRPPIFSGQRFGGWA